MGSLEEDLRKNRVSERGGQIAQARFEYQTLWGASRLVELYSNGGDFGLGFEFHEDIIEIDGPSSPSILKLFQIKTKSKGNWTLGAVLKQENGASILGKLVRNKNRFSEHCSKASLVSNAEFKFSTGKNTFSLADLDEHSNKQIIEGLLSEIGGTPETVANGLEFFRSDLPLETCNEVARHKVYSFVEEQLPGIQFTPSAVFRAFVDQCRSRSRSLEDCESFQSLVQSKFITRKDVADWLAYLNHSHTSKPTLQSAMAQVASGDLKRKLRTHWASYELARSDMGNQAVIFLRDTVRSALATLENVESTIDSVVESVCLSITENSYSDFGNIELGLVKTCIVYEYFVGETVGDETRRKFSKADPEHETTLK